ncbi:PREDICTED: uncharacterized protein LOC108763865 isoform X1 [Trachymyrmex cornetzi]|uniref:Uncharacterized protein n=1 Tax=Trachymyrmex cornetzi TaxID=471704 RepID=A0A151JQG5_9HYME|nr:PREDICTED: uncharacterized protein LOC108763865 isoform X1 [Trachymyrmex cornetzi]KYN29475.1 hypothetical protein ALC57_01092 [Trachymyrmex cornetzi]
MMAGTGVGGVGGVGMLRTRRRDVSVKPNRKLDRKSSRGMIYENEELRLRTIHINAEVEQGQNDIKKLRRENEQLRREIWSLRDEYDKLEEILKKQKNPDESEEYEDRSEEDDGLQSDFSCEEDEEECEDNEKMVKDFNQEEQLENAENQKISSEKMSSNMHRLHVEFDDLSVVDEEEELKRDKEKKETTPEKDQGNEAVGHPPPPILNPRQLHDNIPFYPATYEPPSGFSGTSYYTECPFEFPSTVDLMLPTDTSVLLASPYSGLQSDPLIPLANLDVGSLEVADPMLPQIHVPPIGWQNDMVSQKQAPTYTDSITPVVSTTGTGKPDSPIVSSMGSSVPPSNIFSLLRKRNASTRQPTKLYETSTIRDSRTQFSEETVGKNVRNVDSLGSVMVNGEKDMQRVENEDAMMFTVLEKPKPFFSPQPFKLKKQEEESPTASISHFGTGTSSSSGKTASTVISRINPFAELKGSADIYINGAIPCEDASKDKNDPKAFLSIDNLLITDSRSVLGNQLTKSVSCQDLSSESQSAQQLKLNHVDSQTLTKSDNTLDNISGTFNKPYKSHLNVTLKVPRAEQAPSPETPDVPNLPSIDYRLFRNPFLRNFNKICPNYQVKPNPPTTTPLSIHVNDDDLAYPMPSYSRGVHLNERFRTAHISDQNRLLIPSDQLMSDKQDIQVTSFEKPSPCTLIPSATPYDLTTLRRLNANRYLQNQHLYQNVPFVSRGQFYSPRCGMMYYDNVTKVPAQTQTSIDGDSHHEDEETISVPNSPNGQRRKKIVKKEKTLIKDQKPLSPGIQKKLKKQIIATSTDTLDSQGKLTRKKPRRLSTTTSDAQENKNESRSSSSGQESPRKDQNRKVSVYINSKRRPSQASLKTLRSGSVDAKDKFTDGIALNSDRERTNSVSSREITHVKTRKTSTSSGNVPWCACWGNGCI